VIFICNLQFAINWRFLVSDKIGAEVELFLPPKRINKTGRPRMDDREAFYATFYVLLTAIQWKALPNCFGAASMVHDQFQT
jgi:transposase